MAVPAWLIPILQQFPIATLALGMSYLAVRWLNDRHKEELRRAEQMHATALNRADAEVERIRADLAAAEVRHASDIDRLTSVFKKQTDTLRARVRELERKAGNEGGP